ncbi:uncharacterized protein LOC131882163 isoform X2 [Tigriopus californicus]|uniref:uncharacterized protein LOC131882163 isoform X2 n=1 Tax=Tigriopus californicus TaxID=6832 RepID=UPI0027DA5D88|nr:uncharacterized protein LOC131882163 isoform X2 [Tigriopus californicus]
MLHFGPGQNYTCDGPVEPVDGIPVVKYTGFMENTDVSAKLQIEYFWSDAALWQGTAGLNRSMPVQARITGTGDFSGTHEGVETVDVTVSFSEYLAVEEDLDAFLPPRDIYCEKREATLKLPELPRAFHYNAELIYFFSNEDGSVREFIISPRQEWYDYAAKITRSDYKPVDPSNPNNPFDGATGFVSEVKDFTSGISYVTRLDSGECHLRKISSEQGSDITHNEDGTISMTDPFEYWNYDDLSFASNGVFDERGIRAEFYVSDLIPGQVIDGIQFNRTQIFALTTGLYLTEGGSELEFIVPVRIETYPMEEYWNLKTRLVYNIMGFEYFLPDFNTYDISACFEDKAMDHRLIRIGWSEEMDVKSGVKIIRDEIRTQASIGAQVSLIRIQNIEINLEKENKAIVAIFTLVDYPRDEFGEPSDDLPPEVTLPLSSAVENLRQYIQDDKFVIEIPVMEDKSGQVVSARADSNVFEAVDRADGNSNDGSKKRYSPGAMAGLAFGMLILGALLVVGVMRFYLKW